MRSTSTGLASALLILAAIGLARVAGPIPVTPGPSAAIELQFDDSFRVP